MTKKEILEKSRAESNDEGMENAELKGLKIGYICFIILFMLMIVFNLFYGAPETGHALQALFWAFFASLTYGRYRFKKQNIMLFTVIVAGLCSLFNVINYVNAALR
ncbi:MAG: DUF6442 family protein [Ruthenibacterium sp.]